MPKSNLENFLLDLGVLHVDDFGQAVIPPVDLTGRAKSHSVKVELPVSYTYNGGLGRAFGVFITGFDVAAPIVPKTHYLKPDPSGANLNAKPPTKLFYLCKKGSKKMPIKIKTNNVPRKLLCGFELTQAQRADFDYLDFGGEDMYVARFVIFKGQVYDVHDTMNLRGSFGLNDETFNSWDCYISDSYFSGVLFRFCNGGDFVVVGTYYS